MMQNTNILKQASTWALDAVFPTFCVSCKTKYRGWCCDTCFQKITFIKKLSCPGCSQDEIMGRFCKNCSSGKSLDGLWTSHYYSDNTIKEMIHYLKYNGVKELTNQLTSLLTITLKIHSLPPVWHATPRKDWLLTSVPLSNKRFRQRGFNQSELIAKQVAEKNNFTYNETLTRILFHKPQVELTNESRIDNVRNSFARNSTNVADKEIILFDDVYTTGSTLNECAKILKQAGAKEVWGLTVARG